MPGAPRKGRVPKNGIPWAQLSDDAARTVVEVAIPVWHGFSYAEISSRLGVTEHRVAQLMLRLREEIIAVSEQSGRPE